MLKLQRRDIHSVLVLKCSKAVSGLCNGICSSSWSMEAVMLDFKQGKEADDKCVDWTSGQTQFS